MAKAKKEESIEPTPEQLALCEQYADKWIKAALSTVPMTDEERVICDRACKEMYVAAGLVAPEQVVFLKSPVAVCMAGPLARALLDLDGDGTKPLSRGAIEQLMTAALQKLPDACQKDIRDCVTQLVVLKSPDQESTEAEVVRIGEKVAQELLSCHEHRNGGNQWAHWLAYQDFCVEEHGVLVEGKNVFLPYRELGLHSGPRYMHEKFCIISDRPTVLSANDRNQPHNPNGPSHAWGDDIKYWHIDGIQLTEQIVMKPETLTVQQVIDQGNVDVKRIMCERMGWEKYLVESGAVPMDRRKNDIEVTLEVLYETNLENNILLVSDPRPASHGHKGAVLHAIEIPKEAKTCEEAQKFLRSGSRTEEEMGKEMRMIGRS